MKLIELKIDVFGGLKDRSFTLSDGLNILSGENESGKSTLMLFIKFMLYGMPRKGSEEWDRSLSRTEHCAGGSMVFSHEGEEYRIERSFTENGKVKNNRLNIYRLSDGAEVFRGKEAGEVFLKVPREIFESSAFVGQMRCAPTEEKKGAEAIRNLLSTANEDTDITKIEDKLESLRKSYRHKTGKGGKLVDLGAELNGEKQRLERAVSAQLRLAELSEKTESLRRQYEEAEAELEKSNQVLRRLAKRELLRRFDALKRREAELPSLEREMTSLCADEGRAERMPTEADAIRLTDLADQMEEAEELRQSAEAALTELREHPGYDPEQARMGERLEQEGGADAVFLRMERLCGRKRALRVLGFLSICVALGGIALWAWAWPSLICLGGAFTMGLLGVFLVGRSVALARRARALAEEYGVSLSEFDEYLPECADACVRHRAHEAKLAEQEADLRSALLQRRRAEERMAEELAKHRRGESPTAEAGREEAKRIREFLGRYRTLQNRRDVLLAGIENERTLLSSYDEASLRAELGAAGDVSEPVDLSRAEQEQKWHLARRDALRQKKETAELEKSSLGAMAEDPMPIADRLDALRSAYRRAEDYFDAVELALDGLRKAGEAMSGNVTPILGKSAGELMEFISDGRYVTLRAGSDLIPSLARADGNHVPSDLLSGGTRDAAYLALRIALMLQIYKEELPPLIMDESLCQLDGRRMERILMLLGKLCEGHFQCLLFTCHEREAEACREKKIPCTFLSL